MSDFLDQLRALLLYDVEDDVKQILIQTDGIYSIICSAYGTSATVFHNGNQRVMYVENGHSWQSNFHLVKGDTLNVIGNANMSVTMVARA